MSPHRTERPWQGQLERRPAPAPAQYDPGCYLCPGNRRAGGRRNPDYSSTFVFENDFAALKPDTPSEPFEDGLLRAEGEPGVCRVVCFSPRHDLTLARMTLAEIRAVVDVWTEQYQDLGARPWINHVQVFENRGEMMGASNPHPHCQIWANHRLPNEASKELLSQREYAGRRDSCLLCDYLAQERGAGERIVCSNAHFTALVPFWAVWPFEILLLSHRHAAALDELNEDERGALAEMLNRVTVRYDNLFETPFPYSMGFHQRPTDGHPHPEWHFHAHYYPPLLRSAEVRKFMVGYEMLGSPQRDITPEAAALRLRELPERHYLD